MQFRYARHSNQLDKLLEFYQEVLGLNLLAQFNDHEGYDAIFIGKPNLDWHLEFTASNEKALQKPDKENLLVFYVNSAVEIAAIQQNAEQLAFQTVISKNPYWNRNGIELLDPDGFSVIIALKEIHLESGDPLTSSCIASGLTTWNEVVKHIQHLPYGRNANRRDLELVLKEGFGTCSSKHAFLKAVADENNLPEVELILGMYQMNSDNTKGISAVLEKYQVDCIPEAHCYLRIHGRPIDLTSASSDFNLIHSDLLEEQIIDPREVAEFKVQFHQNYLKEWLLRTESTFTFQEMWEIREECIAHL